MSLTQAEIDRRAQVLADYITLSTLENELQDAEDSGAYEGELAGCIDVLRRAVAFSGGDEINETAREDRRQGRDMPPDWS